MDAQKTYDKQVKEKEKEKEKEMNASSGGITDSIKGTDNNADERSDFKDLCTLLFESKNDRDGNGMEKKAGEGEIEKKKNVAKGTLNLLSHLKDIVVTNGSNSNTNSSNSNPNSSSSSNLASDNSRDTPLSLEEIETPPKNSDRSTLDPNISSKLVSVTIIDCTFRR